MIIDEGIKNKELYLKERIPDKEFLDSAIDFALKKVDCNISDFTYKFPSPTGKNNIYYPIDNIEWTTAFWSGMLCLSYEITGNKKYQDVLDIHLESFKKRIYEKICTDTHDLGFLYTLSCVASYKLTGNDEAKKTALNAAEILTTRYFEKAGIIQAWGDLNDPSEQGRMIIDCLMNLPLLYWSSKISSNKRYYDIAYSHALQSARYIVRENASTFHTFYMDVENGKPRFGKTHQGYSDDSCWARGQAWAMYGFILSYIYSGNSDFIDIAKKTSNYFLNRLPADKVCYWDLIFTGGNEERDSSAAAIACCAMHELSKHLSDSDPFKKIYFNASISILKSLTQNYTSVNDPESNGILLHSVYHKSSGKGIDECSIWGDYFYLEALVRFIKNWQLFW